MSVQVTADSNYLTRTTGWASSDPFTISLWLRTTANANFRVYWDHGDGGNFPELYSDSGGNLILLDGGGDITLATIAANTWYYVAAVFNGTSNHVKAYFGSGGALTETTGAGNFGGLGGTNLRFFNSNSNVEQINGQLAHAKIWRGTGGNLSADEIANEYLRGQPSKTSALYSWLPLLNVSSPGVDMSGNGNDFTVTGAPADSRVQPAVPWSGAGQ